MVGVYLTLIATHPFLEGWMTADPRDHHVLERPRNAPTRTAVGVAGISFYGVLWARASADLIGTQFRVAFEGVIWLLRVLIIIGLVITFAATRQVCFVLQARRRPTFAWSASGLEGLRCVRLLATRSPRYQCRSTSRR